MKKVLSLVILVTCSLSLNAQDILVRRNGEVENVKVLEVSPTEVKYKKTNNEDGPIFIEKRSNLYSVKYKNGEVQVFNEIEEDNSFPKDSAQKEVKKEELSISNDNLNLISVKNQLGEEQKLIDRLEKGKDSSSYYYYNGKGKFTNEIDFYIAKGWGSGYQLRREFNPYLGWNIIGFSFISDFGSPADDGLLDIKLLGMRGYTPSYKALRGFVEFNAGYSFAYERETYLYYNNYNLIEEKELDTCHRLAAELNIGIQVHRNIALGYNLKFHSIVSRKMHLVRVSIIF